LDYPINEILEAAREIKVKALIIQAESEKILDNAVYGGVARYAGSKGRKIHGIAAGIEKKILKKMEEDRKPR